MLCASPLENRNLLLQETDVAMLKYSEYKFTPVSKFQMMKAYNECEGRHTCVHC